MRHITLEVADRKSFGFRGISNNEGSPWRRGKRAYLAVKRILGAGPSNTGEMRLKMIYACHYYHFSGDQQAAERSAFDVLFATAQVVGEERAKDGGAAGSGGLFGLSSSAVGRNYVFDVFPEPAGPMSVKPLDTDDTGAGENAWIVKGEYRFGIGFILNLNGGTD